MYLHFLVQFDVYYFGTNILTSHHMKKKKSVQFIWHIFL
jgi:hypothetical protein